MKPGRHRSPRPSIHDVLGRRLTESPSEAAPGPGVWTAVPEVPSEAATDVWEALTQAVNLAELRPRLAGDIEVKTFPTRWGQEYAMVGNPRDLVHFRMGLEELELLRMMDGTRTLKEIVAERFQDSGELDLSGVADTVRQLEAEGFLDHTVVDVDAALRSALYPTSTWKEKARRFAKTLSIEWRGADRAVRWLYGHGMRWLFVRWVAVLCAGLTVGGFVAFLASVRSGRYTMTGESAAIGVAVLFVLSYFMIFVHELAHALVLIHYGRRVKSAGYMIYFGSPAFFVDASDGLMLDRPQRMLQSFAGPYGQMVVAAISAIVAWALPDWILAETMYRYAVLNYLMLTMNLIPLLELDGYYILADLIQVPDLRPMSFSFARHDLWHKLRRRERLSKREVGLALYAFLGVVFTVFSFWVAYFYWRTVFATTVIRLWRGGVPGRVLLAVGVLVVAGPVVRGVLDLVRALARRLRALATRVRFRLERRWRVEAAELLSALPMFEALDDDALSELAGRVRLRTFARGQPVVRQGERAESFYLVRRGTLLVVEQDPESSAERVLRSLGRGETFGELALLEGAPRSATVRAAEESDAFEVDKGTFDRLLADMVDVPEFAPTLQAVAELRELPCFAHLEPDELSEVLAHGGWVSVAPGQDIVTQGEPADGFYGIRSGQVEVLEDGAVVRTMGPGSFFGEIALLRDVPRTATVRALTPVRAYRLDRDGFDRLVARAFERGTLSPHVAADRLWHH